MNSKHQNQFIHNCEKCGYGTNNRQNMTSHKIREHTSKEDAQQLESSSVVFVAKNLFQSSFNRSICIQPIVQLW